jgi:23S rRNA (adenine2503-C2)-methyltransferase
MISSKDRPDALYGQTRAELSARFAEWKFSPVHLARLWNYLYWECASDWNAMGELPGKVRSKLEDAYEFLPPSTLKETHSSDGFTRKYLLGLGDGKAVETVLMRFTGRVTACVSSQVGCAMGCGFCATGQMGFTRHLSAAEIVAQALHVQRILRASSEKADLSSARLRNLVLMGMGEPLHNYDAVMRAVDILRDQSGLALGATKITVSTVGVVPGIRRLTDEARPVHLAVSLHAATQEGRAALVPAAKKWPLDELMDACRDYARRLDRRVFFEWTLIEGVNDRAEDAHAVGRLLAGMAAQVNLIPLNPTPGFQGVPGRSEAAKRFQEILMQEYALPSTVRQRRGIDIAAGCGQLASAPAQG